MTAPPAVDLDPAAGRRRSPHLWWVVVVMVILVILLGRGCQRCTEKKHGPADFPAPPPAPLVLPSPPDTIEGTTDSIPPVPILTPTDTVKHIANRSGTDPDEESPAALQQNESLSTGQTRPDDPSSLRLPGGDTIPPFVVADPAGGVHTAPVRVGVLVLEPRAVPLCALGAAPLAECRDLVEIRSDTVLRISAWDSVGNQTEEQLLTYRIDPSASICGPDRVRVPLQSGREVCVDVWEYPNRRGDVPTTMVSWEEADARCARAGSRLCTVEELQAACSGIDDLAWPYGSRHHPGMCADDRIDPSRGHDLPGCRSWWGAMQLVGNVWEWTSDGSGTARIAHGGFFGSGPRARCGTTTRSFLPLNRYRSVGFRCCADIPP